MTDHPERTCALCGRVGQYGFRLMGNDAPDDVPLDEREWMCYGRSRDGCLSRQCAAGHGPV